MRVICVDKGHRAYPDDGLEYVKEGNIYTVIKEDSDYSEISKRIVEVYELEELEGYYERGMFIPLSDFDEKLLRLLKTKPLRHKYQ